MGFNTADDNLHLSKASLLNQISQKIKNLSKSLIYSFKGFILLNILFVPNFCIKFEHLKNKIYFEIFLYFLKPFFLLYNILSASKSF